MANVYADNIRQVIMPRKDAKEEAKPAKKNVIKEMEDYIAEEVCHDSPEEEHRELAEGSPGRFCVNLAEVFFLVSGIRLCCVWRSHSYQNFPQENQVWSGLS